MVKLLLSLLFLIAIPHIFSQTCVHIRNVDIQIVLDGNKGIETTVNDCISDETFEKPIKFGPGRVQNINVQCVKSKIAVLERNFVSNMQSLTKLQVSSCNAWSIEAEAFSNLTNLEELVIRRNPLTHIPAGLFNLVPSIRILNLFFNLIDTIEDNAFANLPNLEEIVLDANRLEYIKREWFTNTSNIRVFSFNVNSIKSIPPDMFHGWRKLNRIDLVKNRISSIEDGTFHNISSSVESIGLHQNYLTTLNPNAFSYDIHIGHIIISANLINFLPSEFLYNIQLDNLTIWSNPLKCPCLKVIYEICLSRKIEVNPFVYFPHCQMGNVPVCAVPSKIPKTTCTESVDKNITSKVISYMKTIGYEKLRDDLGHQCAMFDDIE